MLTTVRSNARHSLRLCRMAWRPFCHRICEGRRFSISRLDPCIQGFASSLAEKQPCFSVKSHHLNVLSEPQQFYSVLLEMIRRARRRVFISSLYIGSARRELIDTLHSTLRDNATLQVHLHLDLNRSTRPGPSSTVHVILPLLRDFPDRVHISLFRSPKLRGLMAQLVPPRFNEGWGTWHAKIYGVDDEVMISGANLNNSYFTNRQDRYIHFTSQPRLAQYCFSFLETVSTFSYRLLPSHSLDYDMRWPEPHIHPHRIQPMAENALSHFQSSNLSIDDSSSDDDVLVFPILQAGQFNIREEEQCLSLLFGHLSSQQPSPAFSPLLDLTSGYFGLYQPYQDLILKSSVNCRIIAASPNANGFSGSSGISGRIPEGYTLLEQRFMKAVDVSGRSWSSDDEQGGTGVKLMEWEKPGWTYHAKGIWLSPTPSATPVLTLFGSTNLNSRSAHLDTELSFVMMTSSTTVREALQSEINGLKQCGGPWRGNERRVRWGTIAIVGIVEGML